MSQRYVYAGSGANVEFGQSSSLKHAPRQKAYALQEVSRPSISEAATGFGNDRRFIFVASSRPATVALCEERISNDAQIPRSQQHTKPVSETPCASPAGLIPWLHSHARAAVLSPPHAPPRPPPLTAVMHARSRTLPLLPVSPLCSHSHPGCAGARAYSSLDALLHPYRQR